MEYLLTIRIDLPSSIAKVIRREKLRFVTRYGSSYKSEPHITLYLGRSTKTGFPKLVRALRQLPLRQGAVSVRAPRTVIKGRPQRKSFFVAISNAETLRALHAAILPTAARFRSAYLRRKDQVRLRKGLLGAEELRNLRRYGYADVLRLFEPHITIGRVDAADPRPKLAEVRKNLKPIEGKMLPVSTLTVLLYAKKSPTEAAKEIERTKIELSPPRSLPHRSAPRY
jgi:2'-5' RNA ligase